MLRKYFEVAPPATLCLTPKKEERVRSVFHPFLFAVAPILFLYAFNIDQVVFGDAILPLVLSLAVTSVLFFSLSAIFKNRREAGMLVTLGLVLFYSYGHLVIALRGKDIVYKTSFWMPVFGALFAAGAFLVVRYRKKLSTPTAVLNVVAIALVVMPIFNITMHEFRSRPDIPRPEITLKEGVKPARPSELPDIYYIVVDSYGAERTLGEFYGYDNSDFLRFLRDNGFYVPRDTRSNYFETFLSLSSTLNMEYLDFLQDNPGRKSNDRSIPYEMLHDNEVSRFLKSVGYKFIFFASGWSGTSFNRGADYTFAEHHLFENEFWNTLMRTTALKPFATNWLFTREGVLATFERIPRVTGRFKSPCFVFAHIIPPHHPFRFDASGNKAVARGGNVAAKKNAYIDQVRFVNSKLEEVVSGLLSGEGRKPVIIIQGDHGPSYSGNLASKEVAPGVREPLEAFLRERSGILNAYYLPTGNGHTAALYEGISPVNSFREVFNLYLNTDLARLPDRCHHSTYRYPYDFRDVTDVVKAGD